MKKISFNTHLNAPRQKVWDILWDLTTYSQWTAPFMEGSFAETDNWKEGTKVLFLSPGRDGMVSKVAANRAPEFMSFEHLGEVKAGVEDTSSDKVKAWQGAHENYTLTEKDGGTDLVVEIDMTEEFAGYFEKTWPLALAKLKEIVEA